MISPDDPRLTAYADGLLSPAESARFEQELADDPAARAEVERLRALQSALREAFAEETAEAEVPLREPDARARELPRRSSWGLRWLEWFPQFAVALAILGTLAAIILPTVGTVRETARRSVDSSNLRQIGQACLIFASDHDDQLPVAKDVWDFARQLAIGGGLNDGTIWLLPADAVAPGTAEVSTVLAADGRSLHPAFARSRPGFAVVLEGVTAASPSTTPIAWTRGLRPDGTWAPDSPYGGHGGHIVFLGGNVAYFRDVRDALRRHDGQGVTSNILEALPPGARVGDAEAPPPEEP